MPYYASATFNNVFRTYDGRSVDTLLKEKLEEDQKCF